MKIDGLTESSDRLPRATETQLNRLLAKSDGPSPLEQEEMLIRLLDATTPAPGRRSGWNSIWGWSFAGATAITVTFFAFWSLRTDPRLDEFQSRGSNAPSVEVACLRAGAPSSCSVGAQLVFQVTGLNGFLTAFAQRDGQTNWYFVSLPLPDTTAPTALEEAVVISPEHGTGTFEVVFLQTAQPVDQTRARQLVDHSKIDPSTHVVRRLVQVLP